MLVVMNVKNIIEIGKKINLDNNQLELYGNYKAKINMTEFKNNGKLILVTAITPTPYGEGKTTCTIGINDALNKIGMNSVAVIREPSLGPVFGMKGGATGDGMCKAIPSDDINLHFNGDFHAITSANNLICALIDNHIFHGNELNINPDSICFHRCLDINDRALRNISLNNRKEKFVITAASEIMAIICLSENIEDLKDRINKIIIGYNYDNKPIFVEQLNATDSIVILLKEALKPNLVQSLEENPIIIHGGPFANIAHGCNSIIATKTGLTLCDYVITEAGFGADLGAEKFMNIKCRHDISPNAIVLVVTTRAIKYQSGINKIDNLNLEQLKKGLSNVEAHIDNLKKFTSNIMVVLNKFENDFDEEINYLKKFVTSKDCTFECLTSYTNGSYGGIEVANKLIKLCENEKDFKFLYPLNDSIINKIEKIVREIYHANKINYDLVFDKIETLEQLGFNNLPICIAKTPYSFSDNKNLLGNPTNYEVTIQDIKVNNGAGFIVVYLNNVILLPGLEKDCNATKIKLINNEIEGLI